MEGQTSARYHRQIEEWLEEPGLKDRTEALNHVSRGTGPKDKINRATYQAGPDRARQGPMNAKCPKNNLAHNSRV